MWKRVSASVLLLVTPQPSFAQWVASDGKRSGDEANSGAPGNLHTPGAARQIAQAFAATMRAEQTQRNRCWQSGCLVIVNETHGYDVIGFYVEPRRRKPGRSEWGRNLFQDPLLPRKATLAVKGEAGTPPCEQKVRFLLRHRETRDELTLDGQASLCSTPHVDSLLRIKALEAQVTLEPSSAN